VRLLYMVAYGRAMKWGFPLSLEAFSGYFFFYPVHPFPPGFYTLVPSL